MMTVFKVIFTIFISVLVIHLIKPNILGAELYFDDFNRPNSTLLSNGWIEENGDWRILNETLTSPVVDDSIVYNSNTPQSTDYYVQVKGKSSSSFADTPDVLARYTDRYNFYLLQTDTNKIQLFKKFTGNWHLLDEKPFFRGTNQFNTYTLEVNGSNIRGYIDGNLLVSAVDSDLSSAGYAGLRRGGSTYEISFDDFSVGSLPVPSFQTPSPTPEPTPTIEPTPTSTPTPSPTFSPSPTPTATPLSRKVFFAPGFGASWNTDALINCYLDPDNSNWHLSAFAEKVYRPLLNSLSENGWEVFPYYYDWRIRIPETGYAFEDYITNNTNEGELVNLVGHSMGGLIARSYMYDFQGEKLNSVLTIGSPHKGVPFAYPAWAAGEIDNSNIVEKMATTVLIKRCSGSENKRDSLREFSPSIQNFLPLFDYLETKDGHVITPEYNRNDWMPPFDLWGIRFGSIYGSGKKTLEKIIVKDPSDSDVENGYWQDGKKLTQKYSYLGDGTVLTKSSHVEGAENFALAKNHTELVHSSEGIEKILGFLGGTSLTNIPQENNSEIPDTGALIIAHPSNFILTAKDGEIIKSSDSTAAILGNTSKKYQMKILPKSSTTTIIILRILPGGKVFYKEYKSPGLFPKFTTLNFNN
jgi:pimeloyl-ACP methyl ester carboxylesterase